jgi:hypothetical protein
VPAKITTLPTELIVVLVILILPRLDVPVILRLPASTLPVVEVVLLPVILPDTLILVTLNELILADPDTFKLLVDVSVLR